MREVLDIPAGELMSSPAVTVTPNTSIDSLTELMGDDPSGSRRGPQALKEWNGSRTADVGTPKPEVTNGS